MIHDIVTILCTYGNEPCVFNFKFFGKTLKIISYALKYVLRPVDQIHFIYAENDMPDVEERCNVRVPDGLFEDTLAGINQDQGNVCGAGTGHHIPRIFNMTGCVGYYKFS